MTDGLFDEGSSMTACITKIRKDSRLMPVRTISCIGDFISNMLIRAQWSYSLVSLVLHVEGFHESGTIDLIITDPPQDHGGTEHRRQAAKGGQ